MINIRQNIRLILFLILLFAFNSYPQKLNFHNYSTDDGLPQSTVFDIVQDTSGFLWFGTDAGLGRFDGKNVKTYGFTEGLIGINIGALFIDKYGGIWIGTTNGLSILFENEITNYTKSNGLPDDFVDDIVEDNNGDIWLATRYGGACKFEGQNIKIHNSENGFPSNQLSCLLNDSQGNIWFGSVDKGLIKYNGKEFSVFNENTGLPSNSISALFKDSNGLIWIGTQKGIATFDGQNFTQFLPNENILKNEVSVIVEDKSKNIWFGMHDKGILRFNGQNLFKHTGLSSDQIRTGYIDNRGDLWFGTFLGGLSRLPIDWFEIFTKENGLVNNKVYSIFEDSQADIYVGHWGDGGTVIENGKFNNLKNKTGISLSIINSIIQDQNNNLWFGTFQGAYKYSKNSVKYLNKSSGLKLENILKVFEDSNGYIWFGAIGGAIKYDPFSDAVVAEYLKENGFLNTWVNDIYEDQNGVMWFATHNSGLINFDGRNFNKIDTADGLPMNNLMSIMQDKKGNYWFGTDGRGICRYDGNEFLNITQKDGLTSDFCYFILEDGNELYIGTVNGISILENNFDESDKDYKFRYISKTDGLPSQELNPGAYLKDRHGYLWFGTPNGLVKIDPTKKVIDQNLTVFLNSVEVSDGITDSIYTSSIIDDLDYEHNNVTLEFYSISFAKPEDTIFEFMLEGVEGNWSKTKKNSVTYRALPSGDYKFWVKAKNTEDAEAKPKLLATFKIAAPFYKTWWFITSTTLSLFLFIYGMYLYNTKKVKRRNEALEAMVKDRTRELELEKNKSDDLLLNILPSTLVEELKINGRVRPRKFNSVSIMFTDFKAFTYTTSVLPPEELVNELNDIFKNFDALIGRYGLEKLKTIGDSYMAACGIPNEVEDHAIRIVYAAIDFQNLIKERNKTSPIKWDMRLGIHSGSVVAGVVGTKKFTYDIWGDTVNIASRMESSGEPGEINISGYTYMLVRDHFECEYRGKVDTKGKGGIDMYFVKAVNRNQSANQTQNLRYLKTYKQFS